MRNSTLIVIGILLLLAVLLIVGVLASAYYFETPNVFAVAGDVFSVSFGGEDFAELRGHPRLFVAKPSADLDEYAEALGYPTRMSSEELDASALRIYSNGDTTMYIEVKEYALFTVWEWRE